MLRYDIKISGSVQGIGYRYFVADEAKQFDITGWVRNLDTGDVEISAEGTKDNLENFISVVKSQHRSAHIDNIEIEKSDIEKRAYSNFTITF